MTESKIAHAYSTNGGNGTADQNLETSAMDRHPKELTGNENRKGNGWDTYRRWLTRVQAPGGRRVPLDASLYTWKGYRNWSEKVRRDWEPEDQG